MFEYVKTWYERKFSDPHSFTLLFLLLASVALLYFFGSLIVPVLVALVIAYLLDWPVLHLERFGLKRFKAEKTIKETLDLVSEWPFYFKKNGIGDGDIERLKSVIPLQ